MLSFREKYNNYMESLYFSEWCRQCGEFGQQLYNEWDKDNNLLMHVKVNSGVIPFWKCSYGHSWQEPLIDRVRNRTTCPICKLMEEALKINVLYDKVLSSTQKSTKRKALLDWCIENNRHDLIEEWDFERNLLEYGRIIRTQKLKGDAFWICGKYGTRYKQTIESRRASIRCSCSKCKTEKGNKTRLQNAGSLEDWCMNSGVYGKQIFEEYDTERNMKMSGITYNSIRTVYWKCKEGHRWETALNLRTVDKSGKCPICKVKCLTQQAINKNGNLLEWCMSNGEYGKLFLEEWDTEKNDAIGLKLKCLHAGSGEIANFKCKNGHEFSATIKARTRFRSGCRQCSKQSTSYPEQFIYWGLKQIFPNTQNRVTMFKSEENTRGYEYDVYIPEKNLYIEYSPTYWHWNKEEHDNMKREACIENGGRYLEIIEDSFDEMEHTITNNYICFKNDNNNRDVVLESLLAIILCSVNRSIQDINLQEVRDRAWEYSHGKIEYKKSLEVVYPELAKQWHHTLNGIKKASEVTKASNTEVFWQCDKCGYGDKGEWKTSIFFRQSGNGRKCPKCGYDWQTKEYKKMGNTDEKMDLI